MSLSANGAYPQFGGTKCSDRHYNSIYIYMYIYMHSNNRYSDIDMQYTDKCYCTNICTYIYILYYDRLAHTTRTQICKDIYYVFMYNICGDLWMIYNRKMKNMKQENQFQAAQFWGSWYIPVITGSHLNSLDQLQVLRDDADTHTHTHACIYKYTYVYIYVYMIWYATR